MTLTNPDLAKKRAGQAAASLVADDMVLGLGTGSTAAHFIEAVGALVRQGMTLRGVPTSAASEKLAASAGIPLITPDETTIIDLAVDGADEATRDGFLIKGGGGALLREKIVANAAKKFVVIADQTKLVGALGAFPLPVEIDPFGWALTVRSIREVLAGLGFANVELTLRPGDRGFYLTDGGNYIVDISLGRISDPEQLDRQLRSIPGVVVTGLFCHLTDVLILGTDTGTEEIVV